MQVAATTAGAMHICQAAMVRSGKVWTRITYGSVDSTETPTMKVNKCTTIYAVSLGTDMAVERSVSNDLRRTEPGKRT